MNKLYVLLIILSLNIIGCVGSVTVPKTVDESALKQFYYHDRVKVISGFYKGCIGRVDRPTGDVYGTTYYYNIYLLADPKGESMYENADIFTRSLEKIK